MNATAVRAGFMTSVQDLGRAGFREIGVSLGGALDPHALRVANLLAGNDESAAGLEITFGGMRLRFADDRIVVWNGGNFDVRIGSTSLLAGHPALVRDGEEFPLGENMPRAKVLIEKLRTEKIARWKPPHDWSSPARRSPVLRYLRGADSGRFVESALQHFSSEGFFVSPDSDRMGIRLDGPRLERSEDVDLLSEAVAPRSEEHTSEL